MQKGYNLCNSARLTTRRGAVRPLRSAYETILTRYTYLHEILSLLGSRGLEPKWKRYVQQHVISGKHVIDHHLVPHIHMGSMYGFLRQPSIPGSSHSPSIPVSGLKSVFLS